MCAACELENAFRFIASPSLTRRPYWDPHAIRAAVRVLGGSDVVASELVGGRCQVLTACGLSRQQPCF